MVNGNDVAAQICNDLRNQLELSRLIQQLDVQTAASAGHQQATFDDTGKNGNVNVTAGYQTNDLLALDRYLVEHSGCNGSCAGTLCNQLLLFDQGEDCSGDLIIGNSDNFIHILLTVSKCVRARFFNRNAVRNGGNRVQTFNLSILDGLIHAGGAACLYAVYLDVRV